MNIGFAMCGSFCTYQQVFPVMELLTRDYQVTPIFSNAAYSVDSRFGTAKEHILTAAEICGKPPLHSIYEVEPIGPKKLFDALVICPCTGNTMAKIAGGVNDTAVTMAAKSQLRNGRPVILAPSTNDGLSGSAANLGLLLNRRHIYLVPFRQDDPEKKPRSLTADLTLLCETISAAMEGRQLQPIVRG